MAGGAVGAAGDASTDGAVGVDGTAAEGAGPGLASTGVGDESVSAGAGGGADGSAVAGGADDDGAASSARTGVETRKPRPASSRMMERMGIRDKRGSSPNRQRLVPRVWGTCRGASARLGRIILAFCAGAAREDDEPPACRTLFEMRTHRRARPIVARDREELGDRRMGAGDGDPKRCAAAGRQAGPRALVVFFDR